MPELISDHVHRGWRPSDNIPARLREVADPCAFMNCGRTPAEHEQVKLRRAAVHGGRELRTGYGR